jgi:predicted ATPase
MAESGALPAPPDTGEAIGETPAFGELLKRHRLIARLTQQALAARSGLSAQAIGALERGARRSPYPVTVDLLATALSLSPDEHRILAAAARNRRQPRGEASADDLNHNLPVPPTLLVGRERELALATDLLRRPEVRLLTLTGCPGVGKTRLAMAVAADLAPDFPDGVWLVPLASLSDPGLVGSAIGHPLGDSREGSGSSADTLAAQIGSRRLLLLLDSFEHLVPAAPLLSELLGRCPALKLMVTSRATLHLRGEHQLQILPLPVPESVDAAPDVLARVPSIELFAQRAAARAPGFRLTAANAQAIAELCQKLDGLPLALELTAAWTRLLPPGLLLERLEDCLRAEVEGPQDLPEHQRTMRATLQWSYCLLSEGQRALFRRLSVFAGAAPIEAMEAVCQGAGPIPDGVLRSLNGLVDQNMALREAVDDELRLSMLEVMRAFAREQLVASGEAEATARAHAEWYLALADAAERALKGPGQLAWLDRLERERDNLRAAMGWARDHHQIELGLAVAGRLWRFWERRGHVPEGLAWLDDLLARDADVSPETRARALNAAGNLSRWIDCRARAGHYAASLALYRQLGDREGVGRLLSNLGMVDQDLQDHRTACARFEESVAILRSLGDNYLLGNTLSNFAFSALDLGDHRRAARMFEEANAIRRRLDDRLGLARSLMGEGIALERLGASERAAELMGESLDLCRTMGDQATLAFVLALRGDAARADDWWESAARDYAEALIVAQRVGAPRITLMCVEGLAAVASARREMEVAATLYGAGDALREQCGMPSARVDDRRRATVGETLLDGRVSRAWADGLRLSLPEVAERAVAASRRR